MLKCFYKGEREEKGKETGANTVVINNCFYKGSVKFIA